MIKTKVAFLEGRLLSSQSEQSKCFSNVNWLLQNMEHSDSQNIAKAVDILPQSIVFHCITGSSLSL